MFLADRVNNTKRIKRTVRMYPLKRCWRYSRETHVQRHVDFPFTALTFSHLTKVSSWLGNSVKTSPGQVEPCKNVSCHSKWNGDSTGMLGQDAVPCRAPEGNHFAMKLVLADINAM